jgi:hypothetical protein
MPEQLPLFGSAAPPSAGEVWTAAGPRQAENVLLEALVVHLAEARQNPRLLGQPLRVIVPSRSLRLHVGRALAARTGAAAGVALQTLHGLACEITERAGSPVPAGDLLFDLVVARLARQQAALREGLDHLVEGYRHVAATVRDLLDAGFEPVHREAVEELLAAEGEWTGSRAQRVRARAVVTVAARTERALQKLGTARGASVLRRAAELLATRPELLPARGLFIHGFADATGLASDLLEELLRNGARLVLDWPARPSAESEEPRSGHPEVAFTARLLRRFAAFPRRAVGSVAEHPRVALFHAVGVDGEVREIARRVQALLQAGVVPEGVAVVGRDLERYRLPLRRHFRRLGVPFSGVGEPGPRTPSARLALAFRELLRQRDAMPTDRFVDLVGGLGPLLRTDIRLAFLTLGAGRLRDVARLDPQRFARGVKLPVRLGFVPIEALGANANAAGRALEEDAESRGGTAVARRVSGDRVAAAVAVAAAVCERLRGWPEEAPLVVHRARLGRLLGADLGWRGDAQAEPLRTVLAQLGNQLPASVTLRFAELELILEGLLEAATESSLGGAGGGVRVLSATEARGCTFDHLFLLGLNRDLFPRLVREDALLSDALRQRLTVLLPELPLKSGVFDEDRYLFAQLLGSARDVTISWRRTDEDGKLQPMSPLLVGVGESAAVPAPSAMRPEPGSLVPADELATIVAFDQRRRAASRAFGRAVAGGRAALPAFPAGPPSPELAAARWRVLAEIEPDRTTLAGRKADRQLGPYFGFVGNLKAGLALDPRRLDLYVTHLERLADCPWHLFLTRLLRVEPTPDPLAALPGLDTLLIGGLVHQGLDAVVKKAPARDGAWPSDAELRALLLPLAAAQLAEQGAELPGLVHALVESALPYLKVARADDEAAPVRLRDAQSEVEGGVAVAAEDDRQRLLRFIADRRDAPAGPVQWTDYKVGRPISIAKKPERRRQDFLEKVRNGTALQAVAYSLSGEGGTGRYFYLRPDLDPTLRELAVPGGDIGAEVAFAAAVATALAVWEEGGFVPRLIDPDLDREPILCGYCDVKDACLRGDSGSRRRLKEWIGRSREEGPETAELTPAERAVLELWNGAGSEEGDA